MDRRFQGSARLEHAISFRFSPEGGAECLSSQSRLRRWSQG
jgi:hypothetical protein